MSYDYVITMVAYPCMICKKNMVLFCLLIYVTPEKCQMPAAVAFEKITLEWLAIGFYVKNFTQ